MSHDAGNQAVTEKTGYGFLDDNPLYQYLMDIQRRRLTLVEAIAPNRHLLWQARVFFTGLVVWIIAANIPLFTDVLYFMLIILGPIAILAGPVIAGWQAQMIAVGNYPSPLDSPRAMELLLSTPLTGKEITDATVIAYLRFPFLGFSVVRLIPIAVNIALLAIIIWSAALKSTVQMDVFLMTVDFYAPTCCVLIYSPILTALDILYVPRWWLRKGSSDSTSESRLMSGHSGRMLKIALLATMIPIMAVVSYLGPGELSTMALVLGIGCPIILILVGIAAMVLFKFAPGYVEKVRRS